MHWFEYMITGFKMVPTTGLSVCPTCGKTYKSKRDFKDHLDTHSAPSFKLRQNGASMWKLETRRKLSATNSYINIMTARLNRPLLIEYETLVITNTAVISVDMCFPAREKFTCTFKSTIPLTFTVKNAM